MKRVACSRLLLTSDGIHDEVNFEAIALLLKRETTVAERAISLVEAALQAGGRDNITVVVGEL
ncbi:MAG: hypothetical protein A2511_14200 [Deltaproteobacteria bacterium RIFOXYD12_FULL_50_9]|nr:MAG: hypothetical protein A2511_14200 [Deltaproteobacteria bacterium RIFOXYD12_FULL_50_9]